MKAVNKLLADLNISRILFVDDQLELSDDDKLTQMRIYLSKEKENHELRDLVKKELCEVEVEMIFEQEDFSFLQEEPDKREIIFNIMNEIEPELLEGPAKHIEKKLTQYFGSDDIIIETALIPNEKNFDEFDLIIMDYNYKNGNFTALEVLGDQTLNNKLTYIIFISSHEVFEYEEKSYNMTDSENKQDLFRKYMSNNILEFKALLNFISKNEVDSKDRFFASLYETLLELESGKLMFESLFSMKNLLDKGVNEAFRKLLLTNSKTLKALITEKLESEGVSETSYLIDFSLSLVKNLITDSVSEMEEIHENLINIQGWSCEIFDFETDNHLRDLRRIELLDENVNMRNDPIDFGDIYNINIDGKTLRGILISQSCDLIVREINGTSKRNAEVASIVLETSNSTGKGCINLRLGTEEIVFDVRRHITVPTWVLDFTSLDAQEGTSRFELNKSNDREFTWGNFFHKYINNLITNKSEEFKGLANGEHIKWSKGIAYTIKKDGDIIDFQTSRVGRLDHLQTLSILKAKTELETRIPLSLDLSNEEIKYSLLEARLNNEETDLEFYFNEKDKVVLASAEHIIDVIQAEGFQVKQEVREEIISKVLTEHTESIKVTEQFGKRMLIINENTAKTFFEGGIVIQTSKKNKSVNVICRHKKVTEQKQFA
ncbi:hypothetical protein SAMN05216232_0375 [Virgibacillus subterraneus]|uniref:Response receiver domain-containing protein n=1 Tax=Virgibacillus subterraneus TaxID=621109 RepID=A0A1H8ZC44_9BACI|nr:hypothetical protein [Virgibacillus subterraneus]SEP61990.1 hypothetical protein SAMN05216232_0375 [Virgibacillus subterraneus]